MKRKMFSILLTAVLAVNSYALISDTLSVSSVVEAASSVPAPKPSAKAGTKYVSDSFRLKLTCADSSATIMYSTGGSFKEYTGEITLKKTTTIKTYAVSSDGEKSKTVSYKYKLSPKVTVSKASGRYYSAISVKLKAPDGAKLYYTLDGSLPTTSSEKYSKALKLDESCTLRVLVKKKGFSSRYITRDYTIAGKNEDISGDYKGKYFYSTLNYSEKLYYQRMFESAERFEDEVDTEGLDISKVDTYKVVCALRYDNPQFFYLSNSTSYDMERPPVAAKKTQKQLEAAADKVVSKALQYSDIKERAKYIHDAIKDMTAYSAWGDETNGRADGPLLWGSARCEGYGHAFAYLCQRAGIDAVCVTGFGATGSHLWNSIRIGNEWYHVDVTFDENFGYEYFCVDDAYIKLDHVAEDILDFPGDMEFDVKKVDKEYKEFVDAIVKNYKNGITEATYYFSEDVMGVMLQRTCGYLMSDLWDRGVDKQPWYSYGGTHINISLR